VSIGRRGAQVRPAARVEDGAGGDGCVQQRGLVAGRDIEMGRDCGDLGDLLGGMQLGRPSRRTGRYGGSCPRSASRRGCRPGPRPRHPSPGRCAGSTGRSGQRPGAWRCQSPQLAATHGFNPLAPWPWPGQVRVDGRPHCSSAGPTADHPAGRLDQPHRALPEVPVELPARRPGQRRNRTGQYACDKHAGPQNRAGKYSALYG